MSSQLSIARTETSDERLQMMLAPKSLARSPTTFARLAAELIVLPLFYSAEVGSLQAV